MTVSSAVSSIQYNGNGVTTVFAVPFRYIETSHLLVKRVVVATGVETTLALGVDYTATFGDSPAGGSITAATPPAAGTVLSIERVMPIEQPMDLVTGGALPAESLERAYDRITLIAQQIARIGTQAFRAPSSDLPPTPMVSAAQRANKLLGFDASGNPEAVAYTVGGVMPLDNPTALVGLLPVNGIAARGMRSDGAPALSQAIAPIWTGQHAFTLSPTGPTPAKGDSSSKLVPSAFIRVRETWVNAYDYVTDPLASDWKAYLDTAAAALPSGGGCIKWPVGPIPIASGLAQIQNKHVRIEGHGQEITKVKFHHASDDCIKFNHTGTEGWNSEVLDMSIIADGVLNTGAAISIAYPAAYVEQMVGPQVYNIGIYGTTWATDQFLIGVRLTNGLRGEIEKLEMTGKLYATSSIAVRLIGSANKEVTLVRCRNVFGHALLQADAAGNWLMEGIRVDDCDVVATNWLVEATNNQNGPDWKITNNHANTFLGAINAGGVGQLFVRGNTFYKRDGFPNEPAPANYVAVNLVGCGDWDVSHNFGFIPDPTDNSGDKFLFTNDADSGVATHNRLNGYDVAFDLNSNTIALIENNRYSNVGTFSQNVPSNATVRNNYSGATEGIVAFAANDTTPSVGNTYAKFFRTANSGATSITTFDDGFDGQEFKLLINDANTTLVHGATLIMKGGVNAAPPNGSVFTFIRDATVWRDVGR